MFSSNNNSQHSSMNLSDQLIALTESDEFSSCSTAILQTLQQDKHKPIYDALPLEQQKQLLKLLQQSHPGDILTEKVISQLLFATTLTHQSSLWGALRKQQVELNELKRVLMTMQLKTFKDSQGVINALENLIVLLGNLSKAYDTFINGYNELCQKKEASAVERKYYLQPIWLKRYALGKNPFDRLKLKSQYYGLMPVYDKEKRALCLLEFEQHSPLKVVGGGSHLVVATAGIHFKYNAGMYNRILSKSSSLSPMLAYAVHDLDQLLQTQVTTECELVVLQQGDRVRPLLASKTVSGKSVGEKLEECYPRVELQGASPLLQLNTLSIKAMKSGLHYQILGLDHKTPQSGVIDWKELPADFPQQIEQPQDLIGIRPYLHHMMEITAQRGHTDSLVSLQNNIPMDHEAFSALFILSLLIGPADWKGDNVFLDQANRPVTIDYDMSFQYEIVLKNKKHCIGIFNEMYCFTEMMKKPLHPTVRKKLLALNPEALILRWLLQLQAREKMFTAFDSLLYTMPEGPRKQLLSMKILPDLPHRLTQHLKTLQKLLGDETKSLSMQAMLEDFHPILSQCYQRAMQEAKGQIDLAFAEYILPDVPIEKQLPKDTKILDRPLETYLQAHRVEKEDYQTQRSQPLLQAIEEQLVRVDFRALKTQPQKDEFTQPLEKIMGWQRLTLNQHDAFDKVANHLPKTKELCLIQCGNVTKEALSLYLNKHRIQDFHLILQGFWGSLNVFEDLAGIDTLTLKQIQALNIYCDKLPAVNTLQVIDCEDLTHEALKDYVSNKNTFVTLKIQDCPKMNAVKLVRHDSPCKSVEVSIKNRQGDYKTIIFTREGKDLLYQALKNDLGDEWLQNMIEGRQDALKDFFETLKGKIGEGVITLELLAWIERLALWCSQSEPNECRQALLNFYQAVDAQQRQQLYHALAKALRNAVPNFWAEFYESIKCIQNKDGWNAQMEEREYQWYKALKTIIEKEISNEEEEKKLLKQQRILISLRNLENPSETTPKTYTLKPEIEQQLFYKSQNRIEVLKKNYSESNHTVVFFKNLEEKQPYHFCSKFLPENMPREQLCYWMDSYLGNDSIPCGTPIKFSIPNLEDPNKPIFIAAYLMEDVRYLSDKQVGRFDTVVQKHVQEKTQMTIDRASYTSNLLRALITMPGDEKYQDVYLLETKPNHYRIKRIDNERIFYQSTKKVLLGVSEELNVKSLFFCMNDLYQPLDESVLTHFTQLNLNAWLEVILNRMWELNAHLRALFIDTNSVRTSSMSNHFQPNKLAQQMGVCVAAEEKSAPESRCLLQNIITPNLFNQWFTRVRLVQGMAYVLQKFPAREAGMLLFKVTERVVADFYEKLFLEQLTPNIDRPNYAILRFDELDKKYGWYLHQKSNTAKSSFRKTEFSQATRASGMEVISENFGYGQEVTWETLLLAMAEETQHTHPLKQTFEELQQRPSLRKILENMMQASTEMSELVKGTLSGREQTLLLKAYMEHLKAHRENPLPLMRRSSIQQQGMELIKTTHQLKRLNLSYFWEALDYSSLEGILKLFSETLEDLDLSKNTINPFALARLFEKQGHNLKTLRLNQMTQTQERWVFANYFTDLKAFKIQFTKQHQLATLTLNDCDKLEVFQLTAPNLLQLSLRNARQLRQLTLNCPELVRLDIENCVKLTSKVLKTILQKCPKLKVANFEGRTFNLEDHMSELATLVTKQRIIMQKSKTMADRLIKTFGTRGLNDDESYILFHSLRERNLLEHFLSDDYSEETVLEVICMGGFGTYKEIFMWSLMHKEPCEDFQANIIGTDFSIHRQIINQKYYIRYQLCWVGEQERYYNIGYSRCKKASIGLVFVEPYHTSYSLKAVKEFAQGIRNNSGERIPIILISHSHFQHRNGVEENFSIELNQLAEEIRAIYCVECNSATGLGFEKFERALAAAALNWPNYTDFDMEQLCVKEMEKTRTGSRTVAETTTSLTLHLSNEIFSRLNVLFKEDSLVLLTEIGLWDKYGQQVLGHKKFGGWDGLFSALKNLSETGLLTESTLQQVLLQPEPYYWFKILIMLKKLDLWEKYGERVLGDEKFRDGLFLALKNLSKTESLTESTLKMLLVQAKPYQWSFRCIRVFPLLNPLGLWEKYGEQVLGHEKFLDGLPLALKELIEAKLLTESTLQQMLVQAEPYYWSKRCIKEKSELNDYIAPNEHHLYTTALQSQGFFRGPFTNKPANLLEQYFMLEGIHRHV